MRNITGLFFLISLSALAQFDNAVILGTVRDAKGGAVAGAAITAVNKQTGFPASAKTAEDGNYVFPALRIGGYRIQAVQQGFSNAVAEDVNLTVNARQRVDLTMQVSSVTETVEVWWR